MNFQNRTAGFVWGFAVVWLSILLTLTYVFVRNGAPAGYSWGFVALVLGIFWAAGVGLGLFASSRACYFVSVVKGTQVIVT